MAFTLYQTCERRNEDRKVTIVRDTTEGLSNGIVVTSSPLLRREQTFSGYTTGPNSGSWETVMLDQDLHTARMQTGVSKTSKTTDRTQNKMTSVGKQVEFERSFLREEKFFPPRERCTKTRTMQQIFVTSVFKEKLARGDVDVRTILPPECFKFQGQITPAQLRNAVTLADLKLTDQDFHKLWYRFDRQHIGTIKTSQFFRDVDLDPMGRPKLLVNSSSPPFQKQPSVVSLMASTNTTKKEKVADLELIRPTMIKKKSFASHLSSSEGIFEEGSTERERMYPETTIIRKTPRNIGQHVPELLQVLFAGFKLFDYNNDGRISRKDFQHVLNEFDVHVPSPIIEANVSRTLFPHQVNYIDILSMYTRGKQCQENWTSPLLHAVPKQSVHQTQDWIRIRTDETHRSSTVKDVGAGRYCKYMTISLKGHLRNCIASTAFSEHYICTLLKKVQNQVLQQREYLKTFFQARDRMGLSHISKTDMKNIMGRLYFALSDEEKDSLCGIFDFNNNGRFHYKAFMDLVAAYTSQEK